jgi:hypothetical protein
LKGGRAKVTKIHCKLPIIYWDFYFARGRLLQACWKLVGLDRQQANPPVSPLERGEGKVIIFVRIINGE